MKTTMKTVLASAVALLLVACNDKPAETSPGTAAPPAASSTPTMSAAPAAPTTPAATAMTPDAAAASITAANVEAEATRLEQELQADLAAEAEAAQ